MDRPKLFRALRITWTAGWAVVCLLLIVLWVRSYWSWDHLFLGQGRAIVSGMGKMESVHYGGAYPLVRLATLDIEEYEPLPAADYNLGGFGFSRQVYLRWRHVVIRYWFAVTTVVILAAAPWIPWRNRFSLRTLLLAITLLAVILGAAVYYINKQIMTPPIDHGLVGRLGGIQKMNAMVEEPMSPTFASG